MQHEKQKLYALDFDGVICDSAVETGIVGWEVAEQIWLDMPNKVPAEMLSLFRQVRPVMETGYEAILIMRLLFKGSLVRDLLANFSNSIAMLIKQEQLSTSQLKLQFGKHRDQWINNELSEWIGMNPLFDGVTNKLQEIDRKYSYIITTKQERFVSQILEANGITFPAEKIFGLDRNLTKQQILADLIKQHPTHTILFVEDRLPTLINVINDAKLNSVSLFFADWGYNTAQDKKTALESPKIMAITLADFITL